MPRTSPGRTLGEARRATEHAQIRVHRADVFFSFCTRRGRVRGPTPEQARVASSPRAQWRRCQRHTHQSRGQRLREPSPSKRLASSHLCLLPNLSCPSPARARVFCMPVYLAFRRRSPLGPPSRSRRGMCSASTARCCTTVTARFASATTAHPMRQCESADQRPQGCTASAPSARSTALTQWAKET
jgi:hypothetical protein